VQFFGKFGHLTRPNPTQPDPRVNPTRVQLWFDKPRLAILMTSFALRRSFGNTKYLFGADTAAGPGVKPPSRNRKKNFHYTVTPCLKRQRERERERVGNGCVAPRDKTATVSISVQYCTRVNRNAPLSLTALPISLPKPQIALVRFVVDLLFSLLHNTCATNPHQIDLLKYGTYWRFFVDHGNISTPLTTCVCVCVCGCNY